MLTMLRGDAQLHGVSCLLKTVGWERPGMQRYVDWQNSCVTADEMKRGRFLEIPALHQTGIFRTETVLEVSNSITHTTYDAYHALLNTLCTHRELMYYVVSLCIDYI